MWYIKVFNNKDIPHLVVADCVRRLTEDFDKYVNKIYGAKPKARASSPKVWATPAAEVIKINCDAHMTSDGWVCLGAVARNDKGEVLFSACRRVIGCLPSDIACKAIVFASQLARRCGIKCLIMESDSQVVINRLSKGVVFFSDLDSLLEDVFSINNAFDFISWSHIRRDGNFVAHHLARLVPLSSEQVWVNHCPS